MATDLAGIPAAAGQGDDAHNSVLVGREQELLALSGALARVCAGAAATLAVSGEPGIGKSRLLAELRMLADDAGCVVLCGRAGEFERDEPFGVFREALDDRAGALDRRLRRRLGPGALGELAALLPALAAQGYEPASTLESERYRTYRAVRGLLEALASERPLVLLLDDLHWADEPSLELLAALLRRRPRGRVLLACALRPRQAQRRLRDAIAGDVVSVEPGPLNLDATRALLSGAFDDACVEALHRESGGVPFYLEELARAPRRPHALAAGAELVGRELPQAVALALQSELDALPAHTAELLRGAAVAGDPFELHLAAAAAGIEDEQDALVPLDRLVERDLVRATEAPRRLRFRHPLVRHAVYQSASPGFRIAAHARAAAWLERTGAPAPVLARHVAVSARPGDEDSAALLAEAAHAAAARAPAVAARWLEAALRLLPEGDATRRLRLLAARARALVSAGQLEEGLAALREALSRTPDQAVALHVELTAAAAAVENLLGRHAQANARLRAALDALEDPESAAAAALHVELAATGAWSNRGPDQLFAHAPRALAAAEAAGDHLSAATAAALLAFGELGAGRLEAATPLVAQAGARLDAADDQALAERLDTPVYLGHIACCTERFADALRWFERGIAVARRRGRDPVLVPLMNGQTLTLATLGRLAAADELASETVEAARLGASERALAWALGLRCWVSLLAGELPDALRAGEECAALVRTLEPSQPTAAAAWAVGAALLEADEPARATALALELGGGAGLPNLFFPTRVIAYEVLTGAALAAGRPDEAADWAARAEHTSRGLGDGLAASLARRARAAVLLAQGDPIAAAAAAREAAVCAERAGARVSPARARLLAGRALAAAHHHEAAIRELECAEAELLGCGARRLRDEAARELRGLGRRVTRSQGAVNAGKALGALSPRELEVAEVVAAGRTNKEIAATLHISVNTVESHLKRVFAKLELQNRAAVAAALERERVSQRAA